MGKSRLARRTHHLRWLYKHHTRKILLIFPSLPFLTLPTSRWGVPLLVDFFRYFTLLFISLAKLTLQVTVLYCTVVIDPILTVKKCGSSVFLFLLLFSTSIALYCIALRCIASRPGKTMSSTRSSSVQPQRDRPLHELLSRDMVYVPFSEKASLPSSRTTD